MVGQDLLSINNYVLNLINSTATSKLFIYIVDNMVIICGIILGGILWTTSQSFPYVRCDDFLLKKIQDGILIHGKNGDG